MAAPGASPCGCYTLTNTRLARSYARIALVSFTPLISGTCKSTSGSPLMDRLDQGLYISRQLEPEPPASQASTLAKNYSNSILNCYSEHLHTVLSVLCIVSCEPCMCVTMYRARLAADVETIPGAGGRRAHQLASCLRHGQGRHHPPPPGN
jgi:hypothetical protein